ncbi:hypothetical protein BDY19DRAFT_866494, partial [Irpex rosettiformis]
LPTHDVVRFRRICRLCHRSANANLKQLFNIYRAYLWYFDDPDAFRILQARTGAIVSGSFALQFVARTYYEDSDLDVFVHYGAHETVGSWLWSQGYHFLSPLHQARKAYRNALKSITTTHSRQRGYSEGSLGVLNFGMERFGWRRKVQVIVTMENPMTIIMQFHSTCVLNFITYEAAYCLYPEATLVHHTTLALQAPVSRVRYALMKYQDRGFTCL